MAKKPEEPTFDVTVIARREISVWPAVDKEVKQYMVTYVAAGLPPGTITIDKDKWTPENEKRLVKEDLKVRLQQKPVVYKV